MNIEIELQKIQVLADYYHNRFILQLSSWLTFVITFTVALITLVYEGHVSLLVYYMTLVGIAIIGIYEVLSANKRYSENLNNIDGLLRQVENGEVLPSLSELKKMKKVK